MSESNASKVDVLFYFDGREQYARPVRLCWNNREFELGGVQFWYAEHRGNTLVHHYTLSDTDNDYTFELALETENLTWTLVNAPHHGLEEDEVPVRRSFKNLVGAMS